MSRLLLIGLLAWSAAATAAAPAGDEAAGRRLYREGIGSSGQSVQARVGVDGATVPGHAVPCANCHGRDGMGRSEGAIVAPTLVWSDLIKPWGHQHENGRRHGSFDERGVERAVTEGLDPAGQPLDRTMPRYALGRDDLANLLAYLKQIDRDQDPGVHADALRIGTLSAGAGPLADAARQVQRVLAAYAADMNAAGGIYGRRLELVPAPAGPPSDPTSRARALGADVLALLAPMAMGAEAPLARWADESRVPVVGPFTVAGTVAGAGTRHTFFVQAGLREQVRTLVDHAVASLHLAGAPSTLVFADDPLHAALADAMRSQCERARCGRVVLHRYGVGRFDAAAALQAHGEGGAGLLFFLGPEPDLAGLLRAADARGRYPTILLPGALGARAAAQAPAGFDGRLLLAYPSAPDDVAGAAFAAFRERHGLQDGPLAVQAAAYAAAALLTEGLRRSGRAVSREKLVAALESVRGLRTDASPPLSYGPDRRIGALGGYVVALDARRRQFTPVSPWLPLD